MKCPKCGKNLRPQARRCSHCGAAFARINGELAKRSTLSGRPALIGGGLLIFIAILVFIYGSAMLATALLGLGVVFTIIGKKMS